MYRTSEHCRVSCACGWKLNRWIRIKLRVIIWIKYSDLSVWVQSGVQARHRGQTAVALVKLSVTWTYRRPAAYFLCAHASVHFSRSVSELHWLMTRVADVCLTHTVVHTIFNIILIIRVTSRYDEIQFVIVLYVCVFVVFDSIIWLNADVSSNRSRRSVSHSSVRPVTPARSKP